MVTETVSKTWKEPIIVMMRTSVRIGRSSGIVILQNMVHWLAPSTLPAS
ncbi:methionine biosynthesis protein [Actinomyces sp. oral taxon 448 str. F0400]|nr:methionine biosynthesis protein [Actinomyces sp. oral taxon 448 str. F0400]